MGKALFFTLGGEAIWSVALQTITQGGGVKGEGGGEGQVRLVDETLLS